MAYTPYYSPWQDYPDTSTPITAASLDHIEAGIVAAAPAPTSATGTQYVTVDGDDLNSGDSWSDAKATIQAAVDALPLGADGRNPVGVVEMGTGTFTVTSVVRTDTGCTITSGSTVVLDPAVSADDVGSYIMNDDQTISPGHFIVSVVPGVSYTMSVVAVASATRSVELHKPGVRLYPGVTLRGRGQMSGDLNSNSVNYGTEIHDDGNGIAILAAPGTGPAGTFPTNTSTYTLIMEDFACTGENTNMYGCFAIDLTMQVMQRCSFNHHGVWGARFASNAAVHSAVRDCDFIYNGTVTAVSGTGGVYITGEPNVFLMENVRSTLNWGIAIYLAGGTTLVNCEPQYSQLTDWVDAGNNVSGRGLWISGTGYNGNTSLTNCWFEGNMGDVQVLVDGSDYPVHFKSCMFQAARSGGAADYSIWCKGSAIFDGCNFQAAVIASIKVPFFPSPVGLSWRGCYSGDPVFIKTIGDTVWDVAVADAFLHGSTNMTMLMSNMLATPTAPSKGVKLYAESGKGVFHSSNGDRVLLP